MCHKVWLNSSRMYNTISTATSARVHSLEFWNTQRWQRVQATWPRWARNHTSTSLLSKPDTEAIIEGLSSICRRVVQLRAHKETRLQQPSQISNQFSDGLLIHTSGQLHARSPAVLATCTTTHRDFWLIHINCQLHAATQ